jgi:phage shock protein A
VSSETWVAIVAIALPVCAAALAAIITLKNHVGNLEEKVDGAVTLITDQLKGVRSEMHELTTELKEVRINEARDLERFRSLERTVGEMLERIKTLERRAEI